MLSSICRCDVIYDTIDIIEIRIIIAIQIQTFEKRTRPLSKFTELSQDQLDALKFSYYYGEDEDDGYEDEYDCPYDVPFLSYHLY